METSSFPTDSSRPLFKQIEIFSILTVWLYISTVSTFLNIRELLECLLGISPSGGKPCGGNKQDKKEKQYFYSKSDWFRHNSILYKPRRTLQTAKLKEQNNKASVRWFHVFEISGNSNGDQVQKLKEHKNFIPLYMFYYHFEFVLIQITMFRQVPHFFKTALKVDRV